jgi:hypothetical protein
MEERRMTPYEKWRKAWLDRGSPFCDTCKEPCVWSEGQGWLHASLLHPHGMWADITGHDPTAKEWSAKPRPGWEF